MSIGSALPPWQMWGNSIQLRATSGAASPQPRSTNQLFRVQYGRPETWSFFFGAKIIGSSVAVATAGVSVAVWVDLSLGVGRSVFQTAQTNPASLGSQISGFVRFAWQFTAGQSIVQESDVKYTSVGHGPTLDAGNPQLTRETIEWFPAQDIQAQGWIVASSVTFASEFVVEVAGYVAPRAHVRPDWYLSTEDTAIRFRGDELGGT